MRSVASKRRRRLLLLSCSGALALGAAALGWVGVQAWQAKDELTAIVPIAHDLAVSVSARDSATTQELAGQFRQRADRAAELTGSPLWVAAEVIPGVGANLAAVRTVSVQLASIGQTLEPALGAVDAASGGLDLATVAAAHDPLERAATTFGAARAELDAIDVGALLPPVAAGVSALSDVVDAGAPTIDGLAKASAVMPGLLGADGPRTILVMLQNSAELRTGGGITGSFVELQAEGGRLTLVRQADSSQFAPRSDAILPVPASTTQLYGDVVGRFVQNATMTTDFDLSARMASAWWQSAYGVAPDAVIAIDPIVLRSLLAARGPVTLGDGSTLAAGDLVQRLLIDPYLALQPDQQTAYLQQVTAAVFSDLTGSIDPVGWAGALAPDIAAGRISVWSAVTAEQELITDSAMGGPQARLRAAGDDAYAVYLNDATGGKMDTYLDVSIQTASTVCAERPGSQAVIRVTLTNTARAEGVPELPVSMTGGGLWGTAVGDIGTNLTIVAPEGSAFGGVTGADGPLASTDVIDGGLPSTAVRVNVSPGQSETVEVRFVAPGAGATPTVLHTPTLEDVPITAAEVACRP